MRPELAVEDLGEIVVSQGDVDNLGAAFEQIHARLLPEASVFVAEAATEHPEAPGNIVGMGIGEKTTSGRGTGKPALKILVREKVDPDRLGESTLVPKEINGIQTDVDETGEIVAFQFQSRQRPAPGGVSIGRCDENAAGTLGCWALDGVTPQILSNNHVMAASNDGKPGDPICQQGRLDGGACPRDVIANLTRFIPIVFGGGSNVVDTAIAAATDKSVVERRILRAAEQLEELHAPHVKATIGMAVQKSGRTTGWTHGLVNLVGVTVNVNYPGHGVGRFDNQFRVSGVSGDFSAAGDSGSLVTTDSGAGSKGETDNQPVGLLFAGGGGFTFCNDIARVLNALKIAIYY